MSVPDAIARVPEPPSPGKPAGDPHRAELAGARTERESTSGATRARASAFVLLRCALIVAAGCLLIAGFGLGDAPWSLGLLFAVAIFFGYLVDRLRREKTRAREEAAVIERLRDSQAALEQANRALIAQIEERERVEESLRTANDRLQELDEIKSRIFNTVSHEIKTPLTSIKNSVSLFRSRRDAADEERLLAMITRNADRLNFIISDILDMSGVNAGSLRIRAESVEVEPLINAVVEPFRQQAEDAGIRLETLHEGPVPVVWADRRRVHQILKGLVSNAMRATSRGGSVVVRARHDGDWVELAVEDTGVGLTAAEQQRIFEPFFQTGDDLVDRPPGAGLALTICRDLARGHGSELDVESEPGAGSRFFFAVPIDSPRAIDLVEFEDAMRSTYRKYPNFALIVIEQRFPAVGGDGEAALEERVLALEQLKGKLRQILPGRNDRFFVQPALDRVLAVLLTTPRDGAWVVRRRLKDGLKDFSIRLEASVLPPPWIRGPSCYPDDGLFGRRLVDTALSIGPDSEEP